MTLLTELMVTVEPEDPSPDATNDLVARQTVLYGGVMVAGLLLLDSLPAASLSGVPVLALTILAFIAWVRWVPLACGRISTYWHTREYAIGEDADE